MEAWKGREFEARSWRNVGLVVGVALGEGWSREKR